MATITTGHNAPTGFSSGETVTATKLNNHVNSATVTNIVNADISASADIAGSKLADNSVTQAKLAANVATTGPAFRAYANTSTTLLNNVWTIVTLDGETFDTNNNFASNRFTPTVAGYYQIQAAVYVSTAPQYLQVAIYKNGNSYAGGNHSPAQTFLSFVSDVVYLNGTGDFVDLRAAQTSGASRTVDAPNSTGTWMSGCLLRAA